MDSSSPTILTINTGSSSLKGALFRGDRQLSVEAERIGKPGGNFRIVDQANKPLLERTCDLPNHGAALELLLNWLEAHGVGKELGAVGHRIVHGGPNFSEPQVVTENLIEAVEALIPLDQNHLPQALAAIQIVRKAMPDTPQVACFDTAFHRQMPREAQIYPLPREFEDLGIIRYGFHGLSYESIVDQLGDIEGATGAGRVIIAHLGNGASMVALRDGRSVDTTMGFTPTGGLVMGTRTGDLDPAVILYLMEANGLAASEINTLVNRQSGLLGVSGMSEDMRDLLEHEDIDKRARDAVALFCYQARKFLGALIAVLGGIDELVFTGGIGEHAAPVRERICKGLQFLGIDIDPINNQAHAPLISRPSSGVIVRVLHTDEDRMIARHTLRILTEYEAADVRI